jgi:hypothetical protein
MSDREHCRLFALVVPRCGASSRLPPKNALTRQVAVGHLRQSASQRTPHASSKKTNERVPRTDNQCTSKRSRGGPHSLAVQPAAAIQHCWMISLLRAVCRTPPPPLTMRGVTAVRCGWWQVGHNAVAALAQCMGLPLLRRRITGTCKHQVGTKRTPRPPHCATQPLMQRGSYQSVQVNSRTHKRSFAV